METVGQRRDFAARQKVLNRLADANERIANALEAQVLIETAGVNALSSQHAIKRVAEAHGEGS